MKKYTILLVYFLFIGISSFAQQRSLPKQSDDNRDKISRYISRKLSEKSPMDKNTIYDGAKNEYALAQQLDNKLLVKFGDEIQYAYEIKDNDILKENVIDGTAEVIGNIKREESNITFLLNTAEPEESNIGTYNTDTQQIFDRYYNAIAKITTYNTSYQITDINGKIILTIGDIDHTLAIFFFLNDYLP